MTLVTQLRVPASRLAARWAGAALALAAIAIPVQGYGQAADVSITKTATENPVEGGTAATYVLTVTNNGPGVANGVVVNDVLPSGTEFVSVSSSTAGECVETSNTVNCNLGTMQPGETDTITIQAIVRGAGQVLNTAAVRIDGGCDPNPNDNVSSVAVTVTEGGGPGADIEIIQSDNKDPVLVGELVTYSVTVLNTGPADATGVIVTDTIPSGSEFVGATSTGPADCVFLSGTLTCEIDSLPDETSQTVTVTVRPLFSGPKINVAGVHANESSSSNLSDNTSVELTRVLGQPVCSCCFEDVADLDLTKTASPDPVVVGDPLTYTLTLVNNGPSTATNVLINDDLPDDVELVSASTSQGTVQTSGGLVTAILDELAAGQTATVTIVVIPQQAGVLVNTATASSEQSDDTAATSSNAVTVAPNPNVFTDLAIAKTVTPETVKVGVQYTYNIAVQNNGAETSGVVVTDTLPEGTIVVATGASQGTIVRDGRTIRFFVGTLPAGGGASLTIVAFSKLPGTVTNTATVISNATDVNEADNTATAPLTVTPLTADLTLTKTASPDPVGVGNQLTYTLVVTNNGPDSATDVTVTDVLPAGVTFVSVSGSQGTSGEVAGTVYAELGRMDAGAVATVTIVVIPTEAGTLTNSASVESSRVDNTPNDNTSTDAVEVVAADLSVVKTASQGTVGAGDLITYTVTVTNEGGVEATNVRIVETLPPNTEFVTCSSSEGVLKTRTNGTIEGFVPSIAAGANVTLTVVLRATGPAGTIVNNVTVSADQIESDTADNTAQAPVVVADDCCPDLTGEYQMGVHLIDCEDEQCTLEAWLNVCNIGNDCGVDPGEVFLDFYLSDDPNFDLNDTLLQCLTIEVPDSGNCAIYDLHASAPVGVNPRGKYIIAVLDPTLGLTECRELNNVIVIQVPNE